MQVDKLGKTLSHKVKASGLICIQCGSIGQDRKITDQIVWALLFSESIYERNFLLDQFQSGLINL